MGWRGSRKFRIRRGCGILTGPKQESGVRQDMLLPLRESPEKPAWPVSSQRLAGQCEGVEARSRRGGRPASRHGDATTDLHEPMLAQPRRNTGALRRVDTQESARPLAEHENE